MFTNHERGVAISNSRIVSADATTVAFRWKDYRIKNGERQKVIRLATPEFIRRFLIHVLPPSRQIALQSPAAQEDPPTAEIIPLTLREPCPECGGQMRIVETFKRGQKPQTRAPPRKVAA